MLTRIAPLASNVQVRDEKPAALPRLVPRTEVVALEQRTVISDVEAILNEVLSSVNGLGPEISKILSDVESLNTAALLEDVASDLSGDLSLVQSILGDVGVDVDLSPLSGLVDTVVSIVNALVAQVDSLLDNTAVGSLVTEIEGTLSEILTDLGKIV